MHKRFKNRLVSEENRYVKTQKNPRYSILLHFNYSKFFLYRQTCKKIAYNKMLTNCPYRNMAFVGIDSAETFLYPMLPSYTRNCFWIVQKTVQIVGTPRHKCLRDQFKCIFARKKSVHETLHLKKPFILNCFWDTFLKYYWDHENVLPLLFSMIFNKIGMDERSEAIYL